MLSRLQAWSQRRSRQPQRAPRESNPLLGDRGHGAQDDCDHDGDDHDHDAYDEEAIDLHEDDNEPPTPLLPIFSAAHLDVLPVYDLTHTVRSLIVARCETTISWDQLRSPQISQFLVKPILNELRNDHLSRATIFVLVANCLQFQKEGQQTPAIVGICRTRALLSELLAMRLLREFNTRELIDALSYDFDPLALANSPVPILAKYDGRENAAQASRPLQRAARTSTLEVAIRANAKRFLAHPVVVQHLEAIWAGSIVFHNTADGLHRKPVRPKSARQRNYGSLRTDIHFEDELDQRTIRNESVSPQPGVPMRRSVTLYDPTKASLFKLSRLRVPRYRQTFSMVSYAILIGLFMSVLVQRSDEITALEVVFWFWSAGFMLDEIIGFTEQGFGLYIMSVWNVFDIGILMMLLACYCLRLYGLVLAGDDKDYYTNLAYDVLASTAVLLFPRLFSLLDHYRYFSQLLIAFRLMAADLAATMFLIVVACSGFLVAFTLAFSDQDSDAGHVTFMLFQIFMGFTVPAWDIWDRYNALGRLILGFFLIICHFLVVTILITVLTNSFMAIVKNSEEEHQFLFAVNTISMVKSDALFSYVAPTNVLGWMFTPLRYVMPFRHYVHFNRTLIKITHSPILFMIFVYERLWLSQFAYEPTDLVERRGRSQINLPTFAITALQGPGTLFASGPALREPSVTTHQKDRALEEVFRKPYRGTVRKVQPSAERRASVVDHWMTGVGNQGGASPPLEQPRSVLDQLETRRPPLFRSRTSLLTPRTRDVSTASRSLWSEQDDRHLQTRSFFRARPRRSDSDEGPNMSLEEVQEATDADVNGDDELAGDDDDDDEDVEGRDRSTLQHDSDKENQSVDELNDNNPMTTPLRSSIRFPGSMDSASRLRLAEARASANNASPTNSQSGRPKGAGHARNTSTQTVVFKPLARRSSHNSSHSPVQRTPSRGNNLIERSPVLRPQTASRKPRPILPNNTAHNRSTPNIHRPTPLDGQTRRAPSFDTLALDLASDLGDNREHAHLDGANLAGSFNTNFFSMMQRERDKAKLTRPVRGGSGGSDGDTLSRLMLARMNTLEEGFRDMLQEIRDISAKGSGVASSNGEELMRLRTGKGRKSGLRPRASDGSSASSGPKIMAMRDERTGQSF